MESSGRGWTNALPSACWVNAKHNRMFSNTANSTHSLHVFIAALACLLFLVSPRCEAQNLVANGSFEEIESCPQYPALLGYQPGAMPTGWFSAWETPDYLNACVDTITSVPFNFFSYQPAQDGQGYSGLYSYLFNGHRELIATELIEPLQVGQTYYCSFWVSAAAGGFLFLSAATDNVGLLFTMNVNPWVYTQWNPDFELRNFAQVRSEVVISDTVGWTLVSGSFVADSAYHFVVVGNQFGNDNTEVELFGPGNPNAAYVYVDNICVSIDPLGCPLATAQLEAQQRPFRLGPNPCNGQLSVELLEPLRRLSVQDITGRPVLERDIISNSKVTIDLSEQPNGVYVIQLEGKGVRHSDRFVVQH